MSEFEQAMQARHDAGATAPVLLHHWLKMDNWTRDQGLPLLLGLHPDFQTMARFVETLPDGARRTAKIISARWLDWSLVCMKGYENQRAFDTAPTGAIDPDDMPITSFVLVDLQATLRTLEDLWDGGAHPDKCPPAHFVAWAKSKGRAVQWEAWAVAEGLLPADPQAPVTSPTTKREDQPQGISTDQLAEAFAGLWKDRLGWQRAIGKRVPRWLAAARMATGRGGNGGGPATWSPVLVGQALLQGGYRGRRVKVAEINSRFNLRPELVPWRKEWAEWCRDDPAAHD